MVEPSEKEASVTTHQPPPKNFFNIKETKMKNFFAIIVAVVLMAAVVAPSLAQSTPAPKTITPA